jgi:hypothetical protein
MHPNKTGRRICNLLFFFLILLNWLEGDFMQNTKKRNSIGHLSVLTGLWFINILILIFGLPFLIYKKLREIFSEPNKNLQQVTKKTKSTPYFPCRMDS